MHQRLQLYLESTDRDEDRVIIWSQWCDSEWVGWDLLSGGYRIESAGTACLRGEPATPEAEAAAQVRGLDLSAHRSRPLTHSLIEHADDIFVMTGRQRASIVEFPLRQL